MHHSLQSQVQAAKSDASSVPKARTLMHYVERNKGTLLFVMHYGTGGSEVDALGR